MKGSLTVELAIIFPIIFLILVVLMQCGLYFSYRLFTWNAMNQSMLVCMQARNDGEPPETAVGYAEKYLEEELAKLPIQVTELDWQSSSGWLEEEYGVKISARYSLIFSLSWSAGQTSKRVNPVEFRNRLDFIWEKARQYLEQGEVGG